jgi:hypothetical protein
LYLLNKASSKNVPTVNIPKVNLKWIWISLKV